MSLTTLELDAALGLDEETTKAFQFIRKALEDHGVNPALVQLIPADQLPASFQGVSTFRVLFGIQDPTRAIGTRILPGLLNKLTGNELAWSLTRHGITFLSTKGQP